MVAPPAFEPLVVPAHVWQRVDTRSVLQSRDVGALFRLLRRYGVSQGRLAAALGLTQGRVSEIARGQRAVTTLEVFERVADGLGLPDDARMLLGLAPRAPAGLDHLGPAGTAELAGVYASQAEATTDIASTARTARVVEVLAVRGLGILGLKDSLLRPGITEAAPATVRVMLLDPDSEAAHRRAHEIGETAETFRASSLLALSRMRELADEFTRQNDAPTTSTVECYLYSELPTWRVIALDDVLFVSIFGDTAEGHMSPMYRIRDTATGGALYRGFRRHLAEVRRTSRRTI